jgi:iron complex outermembrane receptor protein
VNFRPSTHQELWLGYTFVHAAPPPAGLISEYAYNFASNKAEAAYLASFGQIAGSTSLSIVQKVNTTAYPLWSLSVTRSRGSVRPYVRVEDAANIRYEELPGVPLPGRTVMGGLVLSWERR